MTFNLCLNLTTIPKALMGYCHQDIYIKVSAVHSPLYEAFPISKEACISWENYRIPYLSLQL